MEGSRPSTGSHVDSGRSQHDEREQFEEALAEMRNGKPEEAPSSEEFISEEEMRFMNELESPEAFARGLDWPKHHRG